MQACLHVGSMHSFTWSVNGAIGNYCWTKSWSYGFLDSMSWFGADKWSESWSLSICISRLLTG